MLKKTIDLLRFFITFLLLILFWLMLTMNFQAASLIAGIIVSFFISLLSYTLFLQSREGISSKLFRFIWYISIYLIVLLYEMFLSALDLLYRIITMDINPEIVIVKTNLKSDTGVLLLTNSITLTPGTITVDIDSEYIYVHWLFTRTTHLGHASELIKGKFEKWLKRIFR